MKAVLGIDRIMIKCPMFTNNIGSGSFIDTFCQKHNKFQKRVSVCGGWKRGQVLQPHSPCSTYPWLHIAYLKNRELEKKI